MRNVILFALIPALFVACTYDPQVADLTTNNPVLGVWTGPYGGVPPFDRIRLEQLAPGLRDGMELARTAIDEIASNEEPATFANTIEAFEGAFRPLERAQAVFGVWSSNLSTDEFQAVEREMAPEMAAFGDLIYQNEGLFRRISAVYEGEGFPGLTPEQQRLTWLHHSNFVRAGARLDGEKKVRMSRINQRLAELQTAFGQNVMADESGYTLELEAEADLAGLPVSVVEAAAAAATDTASSGRWVITNTRSSVEPFLTYSDRRDLRERAWRMFVSRGDNGDARDNKAIITEILQLRAERAVLLGFENHADWRLELSMAKTPAQAMELMERMWRPALRAVEHEVAGLMELASADGLTAIEPWDYRYYAEKVRVARYDLDENALKPYLQLDRIQEGMMWAAGELYDLEFAPITDVPVFHPDVRVWEVTERGTGSHVGLFYLDPYARAGKSSGAWMNAYRNQERYDGEIATIVSNNSNFVKGLPGQPVLITWNDAITLFHEFGHAVHGLLSDVTYPSLSGTSVARDYVELPSQLMEHWLSTPELLQRFAVHFETGEPIPMDLVEKIRRASTFRQGFDTVEFLASALVDMKLHTAGGLPIDPAAFERETLDALGMPHEIVMRHRPPHFSHLFASDGYSAGYYSYLWADVLVADAWEAFMAGGGPYDREIADRFRQLVLSAGNTVDPADAFRAFLGRDPEVAALMRKRGFVE